MPIRREHIDKDAIETEDIVDGAVTTAKAPFAIRGSVEKQLIKIGSGTVSGGITGDVIVTASITFPEAFPTACDYADVTITNVPNGYTVAVVGVTSKSATGITVAIFVHTAPLTAANISFDWIALGH